MSFEKSGKISGTRRKARECALQMLFAADLVGDDLFSSVDYWSELGIDQLKESTSSAAQKFLDQASKLESSAQNVKAWLKKMELPEETSSPLEQTKDIIHSTVKLGESYKKFVSAYIRNTPISSQHLESSLQNLTSNIGHLSSGIERKIENQRFRKPKDQTSQFAEFKEQMLNLSKNLSASLTDIQKTFDEIKPAREFADKISSETLDKLELIDERIKTRTEHWRIERMAIVDRNVLRLAVYEFLYLDTPHTVVINEALEIARRFSTFEATQFINGILDAIKIDIDKAGGEERSVPKANSGL